MYLNSLKIMNNTQGSIIRNVPFHAGANLVVDTESSKSHNKVGKTTFLKLIDIAMGAKDRKFIYTDHETNSIVIELRDYIKENRISIIVDLVEDLGQTNPQKTVLEVELFSRGKYFINNSPFSQKDYQRELNKIIFKNEDNTPTFRQLIGFFVRISMQGDNNAFLRTLPRTSNSTYRAVYNYLFQISDPKIDTHLGELKTSLKRTDATEKEYKSIVGANTVSRHIQILQAQINKLDRINERLADIIDPNDFKQNRDRIMEVRSIFTQLNEQIANNNYKLDRNRESIDNAQKELERQPSTDSSKRFFEEIQSLIPELNKTFSDMVDFNTRLCENKITYFNNIQETLLEERDQLIEAREALLVQNHEYISLISESNIDEYDDLSAEATEIQIEIGKQREMIETLKRFEDEKSLIESKIKSVESECEELSDPEEGTRKQIKEFNGYFTDLANKINGENPILVYEDDSSSFPVSIGELYGSSTGTRKSLIAAYDLAYQEFSLARKMHVPHFVVHDVIENVEGGDLREVINQSNRIGSQYIVAVLKEKLDSSNISEKEQEELRVIQLSNYDRLFQRMAGDNNSPTQLSFSNVQLHSTSPSDAASLPMHQLLDKGGLKDRLTGFSSSSD